MVGVCVNGEQLKSIIIVNLRKNNYRKICKHSKFFDGKLDASKIIVFAGISCKFFYKKNFGI